MYLLLQQIAQTLNLVYTRQNMVGKNQQICPTFDDESSAVSRVKIKKPALNENYRNESIYYSFFNMKLTEKPITVS
jgi:hypothetical protein